MQGWHSCCRPQVKVTAGHAHQHPWHHICWPGEAFPAHQLWTKCTSMTVMARQTCNSKEGMISHTMCMHHRCWQLDWQSTCRPAASFPMTGSRWPAAASRRQSCPRHRQSGHHPQTPLDPLHLQSSLLLGTLVNANLCCFPPAPCALWRTAEGPSP